MYVFESNEKQDYFTHERFLIAEIKDFNFLKSCKKIVQYISHAVGMRKE